MQDLRQGRQSSSIKDLADIWRGQDADMGAERAGKCRLRHCLASSRETMCGASFGNKDGRWTVACSTRTCNSLPGQQSQAVTTRTGRSSPDKRKRTQVLAGNTRHEGALTRRDRGRRRSQLVHLDPQHSSISRTCKFLSVPQLSTTGYKKGVYLSYMCEYSD